MIIVQANSLVSAVSLSLLLELFCNYSTCEGWIALFLLFLKYFSNCAPGIPRGSALKELTIGLERETNHQ